MNIFKLMSQSKIAKVAAVALVLAGTISGISAIRADNAYNFSIVVTDNNGNPASGVGVLLVADDRSSPSHGNSETTDGNGFANFGVIGGGGYNVEVAHNSGSYYGTDVHVFVDSDTTAQVTVESRGGINPPTPPIPPVDPHVPPSTPNSYNFTVRIYNGDPANNQLVSGINVLLVADDS